MQIQDGGWLVRLPEDGAASSDCGQLGPPGLLIIIIGILVVIKYFIIKLQNPEQFMTLGSLSATVTAMRKT